MLAIKARRKLTVSSQIDSGGLGCMRMSIMQSRTVDIVSFIEGGKKRFQWSPWWSPPPLQLVHLDFTSFEMTIDLNESLKVDHILVIADHFTKCTRAYVAKDKALTAAKTLYEGFIYIFEVPKRILMDQGKAFTSEVVEQLCSPFRISQSTTTAYHPQGNSQVEWAHQTLGRMIGKLEDEYKGQWPRHLLKLTHA